MLLARYLKTSVLKFEPVMPLEIMSLDDQKAIGLTALGFLQAESAEYGQPPDRKEVKPSRAAVEAGTCCENARAFKLPCHHMMRLRAAEAKPTTEAPLIKLQDVDVRYRISMLAKQDSRSEVTFRTVQRRMRLRAGDALPYAEWLSHLEGIMKAAEKNPYADRLLHEVVARWTAHEERMSQRRRRTLSPTRESTDGDGLDDPSYLPTSGQADVHPAHRVRMGSHKGPHSRRGH
jgi:hypothetical protein